MNPLPHVLAQFVPPIKRRITFSDLKTQSDLLKRGWVHRQGRYLAPAIVAAIESERAFFIVQAQSEKWAAPQFILYFEGHHDDAVKAMDSDIKSQAELDSVKTLFWHNPAEPPYDYSRLLYEANPGVGAAEGEGLFTTDPS